VTVIVAMIFMFLASDQSGSQGDPGSPHCASRRSEGDQGEGQLHRESLVRCLNRRGGIEEDEYTLNAGSIWDPAAAQSPKF